MKKIFTLSAIVFSALTMNAQVFWTENFGAGCNQGQLASAYTGTNGTWSIANTGTNDTYADGWYVSATANGTGLNNCATLCTNSNNRSLHVGNAAIPLVGQGADTGSTYLTGQFCSSFSICSVTHKRVQSPIINCTGRTNIMLNCLYYEGAELNGDYATLFYSPDGGTTWNSLVQMPQTVGSCTAPNGIWRSYGYTLPASANNNANVRIGFNWINDNDAVGVDPSFAVDDITLTQGPTGINEVNANDITIYSTENNIIIKSENSYKLIAVTDILGNNVKFVQNNNLVALNNPAKGIYFVQVEMNGVTVTKKVLLQQ